MHYAKDIDVIIGADWNNRDCRFGGAD